MMASFSKRGRRCNGPRAYTVGAALLATLAVGSAPAAATVDSWLSVVYPLTDLQEEGNRCEARTMALDAHTSGPNSTAQTLVGVLSQPIMVPAPISQTDKTIDANAITDQAKAALKAELTMDDGPPLRGELKIDGRALAAANGDTLDARRDTVLRLKQLTAYTLKNIFREYPKAIITVTIEGLPPHDDLAGAKLSPTLKSAVSAQSPWLRDLLQDLKPKPGCPKL